MVDFKAARHARTVSRSQRHPPEDRTSVSAWARMVDGILGMILIVALRLWAAMSRSQADSDHDSR